VQIDLIIPVDDTYIHLLYSIIAAPVFQNNIAFNSNKKLNYMKKQINLRVGMLLMLSLLFAAFVSANAQVKNDSNRSENDWITYLGSNQKTILFNVSYSNPAGKKLSVRVFDENHNNLFEGFYTDKNFHKTFCVASGLADILEFELKDTYGKVLVRSFKISFDTKVDVTVSSLNPDYIISAHTKN
jgi:hypothetical protein